MKEALQKHNLELAVLCLALDWRNPQETDEERAQADQWIDFLQHFPDALFLLVQMPGKDRQHLEERQQNLLTLRQQVARRACRSGNYLFVPSQFARGFGLPNRRRL